MSAVRLPVHPRHSDLGKPSAVAVPTSSESPIGRGGVGGSRGRRVIGALVVLVVVCAAAMSLFVVTRHHSDVVGATNSSLSSGSGATIQSANADQILVRKASGSFVAITRPHVVTSNGSALSAADIRQGDAVTARGGRVVDVSQTWTALRGVVADPPDALSDTMIVQLPSHTQLVVDLGSDTQLNGARFSASSPSLMTEADQVRVVGTLDTRLAEMTRTATISYSSPVR